jgi:hypothetical protein
MDAVVVVSSPARPAPHAATKAIGATRASKRMWMRRMRGTSWWSSRR